MKNKESQQVSQSEAIAIIDKKIQQLEIELCRAMNPIDTTKINRLTMQIEMLEWIKSKIGT
jgi:hypothetical protein